MSLEPSAGRALLLTTSTEVSIAPKVRSKTKGAKAGSDAKAAQKAAPLANGVNGHHAPSPEKKSAPGPSRTLRLLPKRVLVGAPQAQGISDGSETPIAYVSYTTLANLRPAQAPSSQLHAWRATIRRIPPPANPAKESEPASAPSQRAPRVLIPNGEAGSSKAAAAESTSPRNEVVVVWSPDVYVPSGHIALQEGCDNAEDWDLIRWVISRFVREILAH